MAAESSSYERDLRPFSLNEVMSLNDIDLVEKCSLISMNSSLRSRVTQQYKCKLLGDSCNNITAGRRAKQDMVHGTTLVLYAGGRPELSKSPMHAFMVGVSYSHGN